MVINMCRAKIIIIMIIARMHVQKRHEISVLHLTNLTMASWAKLSTPSSADQYSNACWSTVSTVSVFNASPYSSLLNEKPMLSGVKQRERKREHSVSWWAHILESWQTPAQQCCCLIGFILSWTVRVQQMFWIISVNGSLQTYQWLKKGKKKKH